MKGVKDLASVDRKSADILPQHARHLSQVPCTYERAGTDLELSELQTPMI